jgi:hypothetical protein
MALGIRDLFVTKSINDTRHNNALPLCLQTRFIYDYAECHYAECHYAECHYAECHYAECHYAKCCCTVVLANMKINREGHCNDFG